jgi:hypothetical protein
MVAAPSMNEADCLARQLRRIGDASGDRNLTPSAYRASCSVRRPIADTPQVEVFAL